MRRERGNNQKRSGGEGGKECGMMGRGERISAWVEEGGHKKIE